MAGIETSRRGIFMVNQTKIFAVTDLTEKLKAAKSAALVDYQGLNAEQITELRNKIKAAGGIMQVAKNTLITRALIQLGIKLDQPLVGPTALIFANEDEIAPLKEIEIMAQELKKPKFKFGVYQSKLLPEEEIEKLAGLPNREILLTQLVGELASPLRQLNYDLQYNQLKLILFLNSYIRKLADSQPEGGEKKWVKKLK